VDTELIQRARKLAHEAGSQKDLSTETMRLVATILSLCSALDDCNGRGLRAEAAVHRLAKALEEKHG
jgi:hypothetical protein